MFRIIFAEIDPSASLYETNVIIPKMEMASFETCEQAVNFVKKNLAKSIKRKFNSKEYVVDLTENSVWIQGQKCPRITIDVVFEDELFERYEYVIVDASDKYIYQEKK